MMQMEVNSLRDYCAAKPGVLASTTFGEEHPSYHLLGGFLESFAEFYLDEAPVRLLLRCRNAVFETLKRLPAVRVSPDRQWDTVGWEWIDIRLDGSVPEPMLHNLLDDSHAICLAGLNDHDVQLVKIAHRYLTATDAIDALIDLNQLQHRRDEISALQQTSILMRSQAIEDEDKLALGQSKLGGLPDLPDGWDYPTFDGKALALLAQINLAEIPAALNIGSLPTSGILYFFSVFGWYQKDGDYHPDLPWERYIETGFSKVLHFDGAKEMLKRRERTDDKKVFKAAAIEFESILSFPRASEWTRDPALAEFDWSEDEFERFDNFYFDYEFVRRRLGHATPDHKLLGYADTIQETVTKPDTCLLCQLESDYHRFDTDFMWGDGGTIYFIIPVADLEHGDFSSVTCDSQST